MIMNTDRIVINYSSDKLEAIKIFAPEKYKQMENILTGELDKIFNKFVPTSTRKFINIKNGIVKPQEKAEKKEENGTGVF